MISVTSLVKSLLHNAGVVAVGFGIAFVGRKVDGLFAIRDFYFAGSEIAAWLLIGIGFFIRVWATYYFYADQMKVISLAAQRTLVTDGPYRFSRNPLYLGGNVFIFFGAALLLGSPSALIFTVLHLPLLDLFIRREEKQLQAAFGEEWGLYKNRVRRWI
jgi:protein-S-isoprenylcysteine O-methyltransferase Ste14